MVAREIETPHGPARAHVALPGDAVGPGGEPSGGHGATGRTPVGGLVLGHGAGGGVRAPDLQAVAAAALAAGWAVALVEQPYRVAGRRSAAPAKQLDAAWEAVLADLRATELAEVPVVCGGRSSGARVACRTAAAVGAAGVLCLAFPLITPKGASRQEELDDAGVPLLVVQGAKDRFGLPAADAAREREVVVVRGDHGLKADGPLVAAAAVAFLARVTA